ncbi:MAG: PTS fructose transporter subunit IIC [Spirochaetales bacterium]|nr:PTS fructose transporter subunit IIC [Spirochaetales bacterium]
MSKNEGVKDFFGNIQRHLMTGVSFMLPTIVVYAFFMVISQVGGPFGEFAGKLSEYAHMLIVPVLSAYIAFSIAGKLSLIPAFIIGVMADQLGMGFLGGLIVGILTGYMIKLLLLGMAKSKESQTLDILTSFILGPIIGTMLIGMLVFFLIAAPISSFTTMIEYWLAGLSGGSVIIMSIVMAGLLAFDMGGPLNKAAYSFMILASSEGAFHIVGPALIAITIPPLALGLSTIISKRKYTADELPAGKTALVLSIFGLTEGAIPFAATDPLRVIPSIMAGSMVGAVCGALFGVANTSVVPSILGIVFGMAGTYGMAHIFFYLLSHIVGAAVTILILHLWKKDAPIEE